MATKRQRSPDRSTEMHQLSKPSSPDSSKLKLSNKTIISPSTTTRLQKILALLVLIVTATSFHFLSQATSSRQDENTTAEDHKARPATLWMVIAYGWITAVSTGLGALPFLFTQKELSNRWLGAANAVAAGMMLTASGTLAFEGFHAEETGKDLMHWGIPCTYRMVGGLLLGVLFILLVKWWLGDEEEIGVGELQGSDAKRALLVMAVMTLHSFAEGVGIGVAFSGAGGHDLGTFISLSLAIHNVPEGLAVAVVLIPRGVSYFETVGWSIFSSLPQPLVAIPVFMFVSTALPWLPVGLGFASGAMLYVALFELLPEATHLIHISTTLVLTLGSSIVMVLLQRFAASASL